MEDSQCCEVPHLHIADVQDRHAARGLVQRELAGGDAEGAGAGRGRLGRHGDRVVEQDRPGVRQRQHVQLGGADVATGVQPARGHGDCARAGRASGEVAVGDVVRDDGERAGDEGGGAALGRAAVVLQPERAGGRGAGPELGLAEKVDHPAGGVEAGKPVAGVVGGDAAQPAAELGALEAVDHDGRGAEGGAGGVEQHGRRVGVAGGRVPDLELLRHQHLGVGRVGVDQLVLQLQRGGGDGDDVGVAVSQPDVIGALYSGPLGVQVRVPARHR